MKSMAASNHAISWRSSPELKMAGRDSTAKKSLNLLEQVTKPARPAKALASDAVRKCTRSDSPSAGTSPPPDGPWVPSECDSSTTSTEPDASATATYSSSGATLPVVEYTASTMITPGPKRSAWRRAWATSLWRIGTACAPAAVMPSHSEAWPFMSI
ncbi:hypothetical protein D3C72_1822710 [compost metagenome]